jgi:hypothetical protein
MRTIRRLPRSGARCPAFAADYEQCARTSTNVQTESRTSSCLVTRITSSGKKAAQQFHIFCVEYFWSRRDHLNVTSLPFSNGGCNFSQAFETKGITEGLDNDETG